MTARYFRSLAGNRNNRKKIGYAEWVKVARRALLEKSKKAAA